ncbi:flagellar FlbD family protein [Psychrobacillus antarcticus]|uniref:flagellar FlbD family protein n=1 Tax=Psychrobacillus antarcticus TaxID=2879115 RepID=UPI002408564D|nr:flagellar FlbD family protein [Psychrobacillus antarcticus]
MINLTRLNGKEFSLNALYIETVESFPDTTITLTNGNKYVALESREEVFLKISQFYKEIHILSNPHIRGEQNEE